jgi:dynein heavy chain
LKAQEIVSGIQGIESSFEQHIDRLRKLDYDMLDVRVSRWHDDYHHFKNAVKDLEVMFTNVINGAFESNATVCEGVILIGQLLLILILYTCTDTYIYLYIYLMNIN